MLVSFVGPFRTMRTVSIPQLACRSKWQCINQTPAKHPHIILNPYTNMYIYIYIYIYIIVGDNKDTRREKERVPGLSATNLMTAHPFLGTPMVLTSGGSTKLYVVELAGSQLP
jgi:hypothetical protein